MAWLPLPGDNGTGLLQGMETGSNLLNRLMQQRIAQQQQGLAQQQDMRSQEMQPLKLDELKKKIQEQEIINRNKDAYIKSQITANQELANARKTGGIGKGGSGQQAELFFQDNIRIDNPEIAKDPEKFREAINVVRSGKDTLSDGTKLNVSQTTRDAFDRVKKAGGYAQQFNQQRYAATTDALLNEGLKYLPSIESYVGGLGKVNNYSDAIASQFGKESPQYADYQYFTRQIIPSAAGEMMRALGVNASDEQKKLYLSIVNPVNWDSNFKIASKNYQRLTDLFKKTISPIVSSGISDINAKLNNESDNKNEKITEWKIINGKMVKG